MQQLKNIDTAFKHVRLFTMVIIVSYTLLLGFGIYTYNRGLNEAAQRIYLIAGGQSIVATASTRKENIPVEGRDHVRSFHALFFTLSPDEKAINANMRAALYLADRSAKTQYDDLKEKDYFISIIRGNISQEITCDSIQFHMDHYPYHWRYYGKVRIIRTSAILVRSLVTDGYLRAVERTDNNPHGFLIEKWSTLENIDLHLEKR